VDLRVSLSLTLKILTYRDRLENVTIKLMTGRACVRNGSDEMIMALNWAHSKSLTVLRFYFNGKSIEIGVAFRNKRGVQLSLIHISMVMSSKR
jgi:hypothetical protein